MELMPLVLMNDVALRVGEALEDLFQVNSIGLVKAVEQFVSSRGVDIYDPVGAGGSSARSTALPRR